MRYRRPFTPEQRREGARVYRSYRRNYKRLQARHAPRNRDERNVLRDYRNAIHAFGEEAAKPVPAVDPDLLNQLDRRAVVALATFFAKRLKGGQQ